jgi:predicted nuclease of predicted toxin-antitoxin system
VLDEMYSPRIAVELRARGHDVIHASELGLAGRSDIELFAAVSAERRAIVTNNADDYVRLFAHAADEGTDHSGILLTSDRSLPRSRKTIGLFVRVLDELMSANASDDAFRNQLRWLTPD